ncbi:E3 SUMO-protein ligase PIAS1 [Rhipicephalus sanguineus]|uniref:E3 SUMO-protein ligase PIAS1 n=1 Tax=Rhipicephalus sanguineus TaxID=34632 RepID=UPI0020C53762|nr:E3 SUMO-protein ligase PIAS1 [Rhipicephalus sanguineus]
MSSRGSSKTSCNESRSAYRHVYFQRQPFYDVLATLLPATPLKSYEHSRCHKSLQFEFLPRHVDDISTSSRNAVTGSEFGVQVHLRLCLEDRRGAQEDSYPADLKVEVNDAACALPASISVQAPGGATVRVCLPVNIVSSCLLYPHVVNKVSLSWQRERDREYVVGVFLVRKQSAATILRELQVRKAPSMDLTRELIKKKVQERARGGGEVTVTGFHVSLMCPLSKKRMSLPCRPLGCKHIQCFDALTYLQVNETRPTWTCPVCGRRPSFSSLFIDQFFMHILERVHADCDNVVFHKDASWTPSAPPKDVVLAGQASSSYASSSKVSSSSSSNEQDGRPNKRRKTKFVDLTVDVIDFTEDSGDEAKDHEAGACLQQEPASTDGITLV